MTVQLALRKNDTRLAARGIQWCGAALGLQPDDSHSQGLDSSGVTYATDGPTGSHLGFQVLHLFREH